MAIEHADNLVQFPFGIFVVVVVESFNLFRQSLKNQPKVVEQFYWYLIDLFLDNKTLLLSFAVDDVPL